MEYWHNSLLAPRRKNDGEQRTEKGYEEARVRAKLLRKSQDLQAWKWD